MKNVLLFVAVAAVALPHAASAATRKPASETWAADLNRKIFGGRESRLADFSWLDANCVAPVPDVRLVKAAAHGSIRLERANIVVTAHKTAIQKRCHGKPVTAIRLFYKAEAGFTGKDRIALDVDTKFGFVKRYTFFITVMSNADIANKPNASAQQAAASAIQETPLNRDAFTGNETRIAAMHYVNTDCSSGPLPDLRIVTAPQNGEYRLDKIIYAVDRKPDDPRASCNGKPVDAVGVFYKSKPDFTGEDGLVVDVDFRTGTVRRFSYKIMVR